MGVHKMLAVNFHLMGGMPIHAQPASEPPAPVAEPVRGEARSAVTRGPDAPAEIVMRRPIALQMLLTKVRENLL